MFVKALSSSLSLLVQQSCFHQDLRHRVRVAVGRRPAILQVPVAILSHLARDADGGTPVGHPGREVLDAGGLVAARQTASVVGAFLGVVGPDVLRVFLGQLGDGFLYDAARVGS